MPWWSRVAHWFGRCLRCETIHDDPNGIGGRCIDCGKVHGWMTRDELRRLSIMRVNNPHWGDSELSSALAAMRSQKKD